ncbi:MAG: LysR substrate-binding domain-containing protein, partial [Rhodoferax sp.]
PLANAAEPLSDACIAQHRAVAVADSVQRGSGMSFGLIGGQDVFTVGSMQAKLEAQLRGLGGGHLPTCMANRYIEEGHLVVKKTERPQRVIAVSYAWRSAQAVGQGRALQWWLQQLESSATRSALLQQHRSDGQQRV